ncbi:MAG TPA: SIS domain-containing protein [Ruminiclostridium sp.]|nr:SIS domain-containing protein [Ruminiclostridium sp.]
MPNKQRVLNDKLCRHIDLLTERYPMLKLIEQNVVDAYFLMEDCYANGGKLLIAGNGGSAADAEHIVGELMKGFKLPRHCPNEFVEKLTTIAPELAEYLASCLQGGLPAIALDGHPALSTAFLNDVDAKVGFAQQVYGYGKPNDLLLAISTSGNSQNVVYAIAAAKALGMKAIGMTGKKDSKVSAMSDVTIQVPETETYMIQELHLPVYHCLCLMLEEKFFG